MGKRHLYPEVASLLGRLCQLGKTEKRPTVRRWPRFGQDMVNYLCIEEKGTVLLCTAEGEALRAELGRERGPCPLVTASPCFPKLWQSLPDTTLPWYTQVTSLSEQWAVLAPSQHLHLPARGFPWVSPTPLVVQLSIPPPRRNGMHSHDSWPPRTGQGQAPGSKVGRHSYPVKSWNPAQSTSSSCSQNSC